eukprot:5425742-Pleurochrysis_carterae.AAC.3
MAMVVVTSLRAPGAAVAAAKVAAAAAAVVVVTAAALPALSANVSIAPSGPVSACSSRLTYDFSNGANRNSVHGAYDT